MLTSTQQVQEVHAFCATCPDPKDVQAILHALGLQLVFEMPASPQQMHMQVPALPAQFHYETPCGLAVIYLAGKDEVWEGQKLPHHASRFWVYSGADPDATQEVMKALETEWSLTWQSTLSLPQTMQSIEQVA